MITGVGIDIISITRIQNIQIRYGDRFARRILTNKEFNIYLQRNRATSYLASRFASKEAIAKALGCGIGNVSFQDLETDHRLSGKPIMHLYGQAKKLQSSQKITKINLSITDEKKYAVAMVVLEK